MTRKELKQIIISAVILSILLLLIMFFAGLHGTPTTPPETPTVETPKIEVIEVKEIIMETVAAEPVKEEVFKPKYVINDVVPLESSYQIKAQISCETWNVPYPFFLAMCESESAFNPSAVGDSGRSVGLMQINKPNWDKYGLDASLPFDNIEIGVRMMHELIEKYKDLDGVVMAYKGGEGMADKWIAEGFRLSACDEIADAFDYWEQIIYGEGEIDG